jgi:hypothetical protein
MQSQEMDCIYPGLRLKDSDQPGHKTVMANWKVDKIPKLDDI